VVDPDAGSFITLEIAQLMGRKFIGVDIVEPATTPTLSFTCSRCDLEVLGVASIGAAS
jgi:hypothetical protein